MKTSQLVLLGVVASAACLFLCLRTWTRNDDEKETNRIVAANEPTGRPPSVSSPTSLTISSDPQQREGVDPRPSTQPAQLADVKPAAAPRPPVESVSSNSTIEDLVAQRDRMRQEVADKARPFLQAQVDQGRAELISAGLEFKYDGRKEDRTDIFAIHGVPGGGVYRSVLAREQYPDLYAVKAQADAIDLLVKQKQSEAAAIAHGK